MRTLPALLLAGLAAAPAVAQKSTLVAAPHLAAPAGNSTTRVVPGGVTILPNGRLLTPAGKRLYAGENLWDVALSPDGATLVCFSEKGLVTFSLPDGGSRKVIPVKELWPTGKFTPDGKWLIVSTGDDGGIGILDAHDLSAPPVTIAAGEDGYITDLAIAPGGRFVYGVDVAREKVAVFDLDEKKLVGESAAGREPYAIALAPDGKRIYVANIGLFDYSLVGKPDGPGGDPRGLRKPPFAFPSPESVKGVRAEGRQIPGIGNPYVPDAQSVWLYRLDNPARPTVAAKAKAGLLIHAPTDRGKAVGGSAPNALLLHGDTLFVANANSDTVQLFDARTLALRKTIPLTPTPWAKRLRGVIPGGMAITRDGSRLYVCESGLNAVGVIDPKAGKVLGHLPSGWFPVQARLSADQKTLYVATQKGLGRGPRDPRHPRTPGDERYGLAEMPGMTQALPVPSTAAALADATRQVLRNDGLLPVAAPQRPLPKEIEYVVFITKENHTFDGIFGGLKGARGEPDFAEFGREGWIREKGKGQRVPIMPNHLKLAEQFAISDNFYMEPDASGDGHRWLVGVYPSFWTTRVFYSGWEFRAKANAPGRFVSFGSNGSQIPEDYLENGSIWEHLGRGGISFRNYGEGFEFAGVGEDERSTKSGAHEVVNFPMPKILYDNTCFDFPIFNMNIPDIARVDWFKEDLEKWRKQHHGKIPRFLNIALCNDHGTRARPDRGYPYVCSFMADNDLALGRTVEYLSHLPEWKKMVVFVTQDDSGGDNDHIDRHRSFVLAIGPWVKRGHVDGAHTSIMSIHKTIYRLFGLGPNNLFDAATNDLAGMFTNKPDFRPYTHTPSDPRVFKPEDTFDPLDPKLEKRRREKSPVALDDAKFVEWLRNR